MQRELIKLVSKLEKRFNIIKYVKSFSKVKNGWATCPIHAGDEPLMFVERIDGFNFFICGVCRSNGGLIALQMLHLNQSFYEVIERLAAEANIEIPASIKEEIEIYKSRKK